MSIFGGVDMNNIEVVDFIKVIGNFSKGGVFCFGYMVVDENYIIIFMVSEFNFWMEKC